MKLSITATSEWVNWFAWYPVWTVNGELIWLETIQRRIFNSLIPNVIPSSWIIYKRVEKI